MIHVPPRLALPRTVAVGIASDADDRALSRDECARRDAFASAERRLAFALGRTAARRLLADDLGIEARDVPLHIGADGAPLVPGRHVSIAHTGRGAALVAVAAVSVEPVGIDVEGIGPRRPDLWRRLLGPSEEGLLDSLGGPTDTVQTLLWALKEAVLKGQRTGFRAGARSVILRAPDGGEELDGRIQAVSEQSGTWEIAYAPLGEAWLTVAWAADR